MCHTGFTFSPPNTALLGKGTVPPLALYTLLRALRNIPAEHTLYRVFSEDQLLTRQIERVSLHDSD